MARLLGAVIKGGGSVDYWKMEAAKQQALLESQQASVNEAVCSQLAAANATDAGPVSRMRIILSMLTGTGCEDAITTWSRRVRDYGIRKAGAIDSKMHKMDMSSKHKTGYGSGATPMGNPKLKAATNAQALKVDAAKYLSAKKSDGLLHQMEVDVQTADAHRTRQNMQNQRRQAEIMRSDAEDRIGESEDRRFWLKHVQVIVWLNVMQSAARYLCCRAEHVLSLH